MEEQKQAEQQWNKIRRERINILKEAPSEENLWQAVMAFQDYPFKTVTGLPFQYTLKTGKNGEWTKELWRICRSRWCPEYGKRRENCRKRLSQV